MLGTLITTPTIGVWALGREAAWLARAGMVFRHPIYTIAGEQKSGYWISSNKGKKVKDLAFLTLVNMLLSGKISWVRSLFTLPSCSYLPADFSRTFFLSRKTPTTEGTIAAGRERSSVCICVLLDSGRTCSLLGRGGITACKREGSAREELWVLLAKLCSVE